jgi:DNA-binding helix-hairpin-helix protein with protein kinase domain
VALQVAVAGSYVASQPFRRKAILLLRIWWLRQERKRLKGALDRLIARERTLEARRRAALAQALQARQDRFMQEELARNPLFLAPIVGIGLILRARLYAAGYRTAADIEPQVIRVSGVGPSRAVALLEWRRRCEAQIARQMPRSLPPAEAAAINRRWNRRLHWVRQSLSQSTQAYHAHGQALAAAERDVQPYLQTTLRGYLGQVFSL